MDDFRDRLIEEYSGFGFHNITNWVREAAEFEAILVDLCILTRRKRTELYNGFKRWHRTTGNCWRDDFAYCQELAMQGKPLPF